MRLIPHRSFTIDTRLTPAEVHARLSGAVEPAPTFGLRSQAKPFIGTVNGGSFDVMRNVRGRNSFRPRVRGIITSAGHGSKLTGSMRVHEIAMVFIGFFVALAGTAAVSMGVQDLTSGALRGETLIPLGVLAFLVAMTLIGFIPETRRALEELGTLIEASHAELW
jgi:hypothetical protein